MTCTDGGSQSTLNASLPLNLPLPLNPPVVSTPLNAPLNFNPPVVSTPLNAPLNLNPPVVNTPLNEAAVNSLNAPLMTMNPPSERDGFMTTTTIANSESNSHVHQDHGLNQVTKGQLPLVITTNRKDMEKALLILVNEPQTQQLLNDFIQNKEMWKDWINTMNART